MKTSWPSWVVVASLLGTTLYCLAEDFTLTGYYPSPRGVYEELKTGTLKSLSSGIPIIIPDGFKITAGSPGDKKVLTSDADGVASWATPSSGTVIGMTGGVYTGAGVGGYGGGNDKCNAAFPGSRMAYVGDLVSGPPPAGAYGWVNTFTTAVGSVGGGTGTQIDDCTGWTNGGWTDEGTIWVSPYVHTAMCGPPQPILCSK